MPFLADTDPRDERRGPVWAAFATVVSQVERLVAANLAWAAVLAPGVVALAFPELPVGLRVVLGLASATGLPPATAVLYGIASQACRRQHVDLGFAGELARKLTAPSLRTLAPLYGTFGALLWALWLIGSVPGLAALRVPLTAVLLAWTVCAMYWGPLFVGDPRRSATEIASTSARLVWRRPEQALGTWLVAVLALIIGAVSVAGLVLIVPVLIMILHTHRYQTLAE